jgi:urease accessory protein
MSPADMTSAPDTALIFRENRAQGHIDLSVRAHGGRTVREVVAESGSYRVRFPNMPGREAEAVIVNTAGGVAGGDTFSTAISVGEGASLAVTTAAAEKVYRAIDRESRMDVRLNVAAGGALRWVPQETILFDEADLYRRIDVDLADNAEMLMAELVIFGRTAMNETMQRGHWTDRWRIRRGGRLVFAETVRLHGDIGALLAHPAAGGGAVALATLIVAPGDEALATRLREHLADCRCEAGVSAWNGMTVVRLCGGDAAVLRAVLVSVLNAFGGVLPRLWMN